MGAANFIRYLSKLANANHHTRYRRIVICRTLIPDAPNGDSASTKVTHGIKVTGIIP